MVGSDKVQAERVAMRCVMSWRLRSAYDMTASDGVLDWRSSMGKAGCDRGMKRSWFGGSVRVMSGEIGMDAAVTVGLWSGRSSCGGGWKGGCVS
jgi:hypothetical protein